jgi:hypothetical protein
VPTPASESLKDKERNKKTSSGEKRVILGYNS